MRVLRIAAASVVWLPACSVASTRPRTRTGGESYVVGCPCSTIDTFKHQHSSRRPASLQHSFLKCGVAVRFCLKTRPCIALQASICERKSSFHTAAAQHRSFATGAPIHHAAAALHCSLVQHEQRCHHGAEIEAQSDDEEDAGRAPRRRRHDRDAGHRLALQDHRRRRHPRAAGGDGRGPRHGRAAGLIDSRAARRRVGLHVLVGRAERR